MAKMFPKHGVKCNDSKSAEPMVYKLLKKQLDDSFSVIHSIPWLTQFARGFSNFPSPIGEVDFIILHSKLGILAIEVKGGKLSHERSGFFYGSKNFPTYIDPVGQLNRGIFAIQRWMRDKGKKIMIGRAYCFPESETTAANLPPSVITFDKKYPINLILDITDKPRFRKKIIEIMEYFKAALSVPDYSDRFIEELIDNILPTVDYSPCWVTRINNDNFMWLKLTEEQTEAVHRALNSEKLLINGWPGSGKTIVGIQCTRSFIDINMKVLFITFNKLLSEKVALEIGTSNFCLVTNFHKLCSLAATYLGENINDDQEWLTNGAEKMLDKACNQGFLNSYDALVVDEAQSFQETWWSIFFDQFRNKKVVIMCDETQALPHESPVSLSHLEDLLGVKSYLLTKSLRLPKKVCERIKIFSDPHYSVVNPREFEEDSLNEILSVSILGSLNQTIDQLYSENVNPCDIVILSAFRLDINDLVNQRGIQYETIGRFRGMERPIVIVIVTPDIADSQLFVAYSRATSKCIVLLDAEEVRKNRYSILSEKIRKARKNDLDKELEKLLIKNLVKGKISQQNVDLKTINLTWCEQWKSYILLPLNNETYRVYWEAYFESIDHPLIVTWTKNCEKYIKEIIIRKSLTEFIESPQLTPRICSTCSNLSIFPLYTTNPTECLACRNPRANRDTNFERTCIDIENIILNPHEHDKSAKVNLPLPIFSLSALINNDLVKNDKNLSNQIKRCRKWYGKSVIGLLVYELRRSSTNNELTVKVRDVAIKIQNWNAHAKQIKFEKWQGFVNDAFAKLEKSGIVQRSAKRGYRDINSEQLKNLIG